MHSLVQLDAEPGEDDLQNALDEITERVDVFGLLRRALLVQNIDLNILAQTVDRKKLVVAAVAVDHHVFAAEERVVLAVVERLGHIHRAQRRAVFERL